MLGLISPTPRKKGKYLWLCREEWRMIVQVVLTELQRPSGGTKSVKRAASWGPINYYKSPTTGHLKQV
jgi:hypothetical protein